MPLPVAVEFAIGSATGMLDCILFHWIDTLKVRRQDGRPLFMDVRTGQPLPRTPGVGFLKAGIKSLYAGFSTNLSLKVPYMASMFAFNALNTQVLDRLLSEKNSSSSSTVDGSTRADKSTLAKEFASAALVGVEVSLLLSPLEMVRIQGQNNGKGGLISATHAVAATAKGGGLHGWWKAWTRGMTATMHRESKYCAGQFFLCAKISEYVSARMQEQQQQTEDGKASPAGAARETVASQVAGAVLGGIACTVVSHPDDVIKTRMQTHLKGSSGYESYATYSGSMMRVLREEGFGTLFRGAAFRCLLRVPLGLSVIIVSGSWMRERAERSLRE